MIMQGYSHVQNSRDAEPRLTSPTLFMMTIQEEFQRGFYPLDNNWSSWNASRLYFSPFLPLVLFEVVGTAVTAAHPRVSFSKLDPE